MNITLTYIQINLINTIFVGHKCRALEGRYKVELHMVLELRLKFIRVNKKCVQILSVKII